MKTRPIQWIILGLMVALNIGGALFYLSQLPRHPPRDQMNALVRDGDAIVRSLEQHYAQHQRYPGVLSPALPLARGARYGEWQYVCRYECSTFKLHVGRYGEHGFEIWWLPDEKRWYIDT